MSEDGAESDASTPDAGSGASPDGTERSEPSDGAERPGPSDGADGSDGGTSTTDTDDEVVAEGQEYASPASVEEWTREWLQQRATAQDVTPGELLKRFAAAYRLVEEDEVPDVDFETALDDLEAVVRDLESVVDDVSDDVSSLDQDVSKKIQDVRERVIQVKREADGKADEDHAHPELAARLATVSENTASSSSRLDELTARVDSLDTRLGEGFENYRDILEFLTDEVDDVSEKNTRLARAINSMREALQEMTGREGRRIAADRLREQANKHGVRTADCDDCGATLDIALLTDARCPHCASTFASVEPKRGFFGSPTLEVGERPALEAGDAPDANDMDVSGVVADGNGSTIDVVDILGDRDVDTPEVPESTANDDPDENGADVGER